VKSKIFLISLCCLVLTACSLFQSSRGPRHSWDSQKHQGIYLKTISFPTQDNGWVAGKGGIIWHSNNGGSTWTPQSTPTQETLNKIFFFNTQEGLAVGSTGVIVYTEDGGRTWGPRPSNTNSNLNDVFFLNDTQGWIVGDGSVVLTTSNGGQSWASQSIGSASTNLFSIYFVDSNHGWIVGASGEIWVTTNGGSLWGPQYSNTGQDLRSVYFIDQNKGFAAGGEGFTAGGVPSLDRRVVGTVLAHRLLLRTDDGGANWNPVINREGDPFHRVVFVDADHGWLVAGGEYYVSEQVPVGNQTGPTGAIYFTADGGSNWNPQYQGLVEPVYDIWFLDTNKGFAVGADTTSKFLNPGIRTDIGPDVTRILKTTNGGRP